MKTKLLKTLLYVVLAGKATAFLNVKEQRRIHNLQTMPKLCDETTTSTHLWMMDQIVTVPSMFQDLNPDITAEMMTDISHVALDFTGFLTVSRLHILSFSILGRLLELYTDFLPGHSVPPEELAVQAFLLVSNIRDLANSIAENRSVVK